jgi:hypothetical protein
MTPTLERVRHIVSEHSGVRLDKLNAQSAIDQDVGLSGDDIHYLAEALAKEFGDHVWQWPWHRFAELSEPSALILPYFMWRLLTWPIRGRLFDPSFFERLELGHIAAVIEKGEWFEP